MLKRGLDLITPSQRQAPACHRHQICMRPTSRLCFGRQVARGAMTHRKLFRRRYSFSAMFGAGHQASVRFASHEGGVSRVLINGSTLDGCPALPWRRRCRRVLCIAQHGICEYLQLWCRNSYVAVNDAELMSQLSDAELVKF